MNVTNDNREEMVEEWITESWRQSYSRTRKYYIYTLIPITAGIIWMIFSIKQVYQLNSKIGILNDSLHFKKTELNIYSDSIQMEKQHLELLKYLRDRDQIEYLKLMQQHSGNMSIINQVLQQSIQANQYLNDLLSKNKINKNLVIQYFKKNADAERVWLSLKQIGYKHIENEEPANDTLAKAESDAIFFGKQTNLIDVKVIALVLIRAGFNVKTVALMDDINEYSIQIGSVLVKKPFLDEYGPLDRRPISVDQITKADNVASILY